MRFAQICTPPPLTKTFRRACRQRTLSKGPIVRGAPRSPPKLPFSGNWVRVIVPSWARRSSHHEHLDRFSRFCISHGCVQQTDRQTDIQTDGRTDGQTDHATIDLKQPVTSVCMRYGLATTAACRSGYRRSSMNVVNARRARLQLGWVTVFGRVYRLGM